MIKKLLGGIFVLGFSILNFSFGTLFEYHNIGVVTDVNGINVSVESKGNLLSNSKKLLNFGNNTFVFWTQDLTGNILLYAYTSDGGLMNGDFQQGFFNTFSLCDEITNLDKDPQNCTDYYTYENLEILQNFMANVNSSDIYGIIKNSTRHNVYLTISSNTLGKSVFFSSQRSNNFINSLNIGNYSFENFPNNLLYNSPTQSNGGGNGDGGDDGEGGGENEDQTPGITPGSDESAIDYFEDRYGRDESICYVGIDNITTMYGSSVSFNQGTGLNIFEVYSLLYNNSDLDKVYVWLNTRLINYEQWFLRDNPLYLASYNSGTNKVNLYYENLTFPFANNPVALYFMASNITYHSEYSTMGSEVVSYCNIKINGGNFDDIIDPSVKNNINNYTEQSNKSKGFNPDGTPKVFSGFMDGTGSSQFLSGLDIEEYTGGISDFFDNSINQLKGLLDDGNPFTGVLPNWLVFGFLLVALFKILKHY